MDDLLAPSGGSIVGTCNEMCPKQERFDREQSRDLSYFEQIPGTGSSAVGDFPRVDHKRAVKKYARSAAGREIVPHLVRTEPTLVITMEYLLNRIVDTIERPFHEVNLFVSDRFRSIRQDYACQSLNTPSRLAILEYQVRYYIIAGYFLADAELSVFNPNQNQEALMNCITDIVHLYNSGLSIEHAPEFYAYHVLLTLDCQDVPYQYLNTKPVQLALQILFYSNNSNWVGLIHLLTSPTQCPFTFCCLIVTRFLSSTRRMAIRMMYQAYVPPPSLDKLQSTLLLSRDDAIMLCFACAINPFDAQKGITAEILQQHGYDPDSAIECWGIRGDQIKKGDRTIHLPPAPRVRPVQKITDKMHGYSISQITRMTYENHIDLFGGKIPVISGPITAPAGTIPTIVAPTAIGSGGIQQQQQQIQPHINQFQSKQQPSSHPLNPSAPAFKPPSSSTIGEDKTTPGIGLIPPPPPPPPPPPLTRQLITANDFPAIFKTLGKSRAFKGGIPSKWRQQEHTLYQRIQSLRHTQYQAIQTYKSRHQQMVEDTRRQQEDVIKEMIFNSQLTYENQHRLRFLYNLSKKTHHSLHLSHLRSAVHRCTEHYRYIHHLKQLSERLAITRALHVWQQETRRAQQRNAYTAAVYQRIIDTAKAKGDVAILSAHVQPHGATTTTTASSSSLSSTHANDDDHAMEDATMYDHGQEFLDYEQVHMPEMATVVVVSSPEDSLPQQPPDDNDHETSVLSPSSPLSRDIYDMPSYLLIQPMNLSTFMMYLGISPRRQIGQMVSTYDGLQTLCLRNSLDSHMMHINTVYNRSILYYNLQSFYHYCGYLPTTMYQLRISPFCIPRGVLHQYYTLQSHMQSMNSMNALDDDDNDEDSPYSTQSRSLATQELRQFEEELPSLVLLTSLYKLFQLDHDFRSRNYVHKCSVRAKTTQKPQHQQKPEEPSLELAILPRDTNISHNLNQFELMELMKQQSSPSVIMNVNILSQSIPFLFSSSQTRHQTLLDTIAMYNNGITIIPTSSTISIHLLSTIYQFIRNTICIDESTQRVIIQPQLQIKVMLFLDKLIMNNYTDDYQTIQQMKQSLISATRLSTQAFHESTFIHPSPSTSALRNTPDNNPEINAKDMMVTRREKTQKQAAHLRGSMPSPMTPIIITSIDHHGLEWVEQYRSYLTQQHQQQQQHMRANQDQLPPSASSGGLEPPLELIFDLIGASLHRCMWLDLYATHQQSEQATRLTGGGDGLSSLSSSSISPIYSQVEPTTQYGIDINDNNTLVPFYTLSFSTRRILYPLVLQCHAVCVANGLEDGHPLSLQCRIPALVAQCFSQNIPLMFTSL